MEGARPDGIMEGVTWWLVVLLMFAFSLAAIVLPSPKEWLRYRRRREALPARRRRRMKGLTLSWVRRRPVREKPLDPRLLAGGLSAGAFSAGSELAADSGGEGGEGD